MKNNLVESLNTLHKEEKHQEITDKIEKLPDNADSHLFLCWIYQEIKNKEKENYEKAKEYFKNVDKVDKYIVFSLDKNEELKKDYKTVNELINSNIYFNLMR